MRRLGRSPWRRFRGQEVYLQPGEETLAFLWSRPAAAEVGRGRRHAAGELRGDAAVRTDECRDAAISLVTFASLRLLSTDSLCAADAKTFSGSSKPFQMWKPLRRWTAASDVTSLSNITTTREPLNLSSWPFLWKTEPTARQTSLISAISKASCKGFSCDSHSLCWFTPPHPKSSDPTKPPVVLTHESRIKGFVYQAYARPFSGQAQRSSVWT